MKKFVTLFLAMALCMGLAVPAFATEGYEEVTIDYSGFFGSELIGQVTLAQARPVTNATGYVYYYEVPAQVQVTVTLNENQNEEYPFAVRWFNADLRTDGYSNAVDVAYALANSSGELTEYAAAPGFMEHRDHQLTPGQSYTFTIQADRSNAVILDCGPRNDFFLQGIGGGGIQLRCAGSAAQPEEPAVTTGFADVPADAWYTEPVGWAVEKGITDGTSKTTFSPNNTCTTAQIITFLWRAYGSLSLSDENPFTDVDEDAYYADAAVWAARNGLVSGDTFGGNTPCTRSATVTYLWKLAGMPSADPADFTDVDADAEYAEAVAWAVANGITDGTGKNTFSPDNTCTRAQIVTFLYRGYGGVIE